MARRKKPTGSSALRITILLLLMLLLLSFPPQGSPQMNFLEKLGILSQLRGVGVSQSQVFLNQNHMVILVGFCHNKWGFLSTNLFHPKNGTFS